MQDRRTRNIPVATERRGFPKGMTHPCTSEVAYHDDESEFMGAIQKYKDERRRPFPTWREILLIAKSLGYRKVADNTFKELLNGTVIRGSTEAG